LKDILRNVRKTPNHQLQPIETAELVVKKNEKTVGVSHESIAMAIYLLIQVNRTY